MLRRGSMASSYFFFAASFFFREAFAKGPKRGIFPYTTKRSKEEEGKEQKKTLEQLPGTGKTVSDKESTFLGKKWIKERCEKPESIRRIHICGLAARIAAIHPGLFHTAHSSARFLGMHGR